MTLTKPTFENNIAYQGGAIFLTYEYDESDSAVGTDKSIVLKDLKLSDIKSLGSGGFMYFNGEDY